MIIRVRASLPVVAAALVVAGVTGCSAAPQLVQWAFDQRYPGFENVMWEQQPYGWEAAFGGDDGAYEAEFTSNGDWLETEVEVVDGAGFPPAVRQAVQSATGGQPHREVGDRGDPDGGVLRSRGPRLGRRVVLRRRRAAGEQPLRGRLSAAPSATR